MPAKKKEVKVDEPLFVDEEGSYVHEVECARYKGGVRRYTNVSVAEGSLAASSVAGHTAPGSPPGKGSASPAPATAAAATDASVCRHGRGVYTCPSFTYVGDWMEDEMHGHGHLTFTQTGHVYDGMFAHGCFGGQGTYTWCNGSVYCGQWRANRMHGDGVYTDAQGHVWKGRYYNGTGPGLTRLYPTLEYVDGVHIGSPGRLLSPANGATNEI